MEETENIVEYSTEKALEQEAEKLVEGSKVTANTNENISNEEKLYTKSDIDKLVNEKVNELLPSKIERAKNKLQRENQEKLGKYEKIERILNAGLGTKNIDETISQLSEFYKEKGVEIPEQPIYSERDLDILANAEATDIINSGYEELVEEVDRLAEKGVNNMTQREKIVFQKLAEERKKQESIQELSKLGIGSELFNDKDYQEFVSKLNPNMSEKDKYEMYTKFKPKSNIEPLGSMKGTVAKDNGVKEFYSFEEASKFTKKDFDENPALYKAVCKSMEQWGK